MRATTNSDLHRLIVQLVDCGTWSKEHEDYYLYTFIPELQTGSANATDEERQLIKQIREVANARQWRFLLTHVKKYLSNPEARKRAQIARDRIVGEKERQRLERRQQEIAARKAELKQDLLNALYESIALADQRNGEINREGLFDYSALKNAYLRRWLLEREPSSNESPEQLHAIGDMSHSYLLRARAGSGKTSVVVAKACVLIEHENIPPDQLMILAFNKRAASDVKNKLSDKCGPIEFDNAHTFHSLAYQIAQRDQRLGEILFDEKTGDTKKQSAFVQKLIKSVMNPALLAQMYLFFRREIKELDKSGSMLSEAELYSYRRNQVQDTLGGQYVKSIGEKWLADFLFEYDIRYVYERRWFWNDEMGGAYRPDFSISTSGKHHDVVIEHWGIDLDDPLQKVPEHWNRTWHEYRDEIDRKRKHWEHYNIQNPGQPVLFLETSVADLRGGRESFEGILNRMFATAGIVLQKLPERDLHQKVVVNRIARFSSMCLQYIQKAKKQRLSPEDMDQKIIAEPDLDAKTKAFLSIANSLYRRYQKKLVAQNMVDFDDLLEIAINIVKRTEGEATIRVEKNRWIDLNSLRWIMIDEYQDFSPLFYDLIDSIRTFNKKVRLFCVGDDWQAINAFAGSDLRFFGSFGDLIDGGVLGDLQNNYRSAMEIVDLGNRLMDGKGKPSRHTRVDLNGSVEVCRTDKIWIEQRYGEEFLKAREEDARFQSWIDSDGWKKKVDRDLRLARMLKKCHALLTDPCNNPRTEFAVLSRVERLGKGFPDLQAFHKKLKSTLSTEERRTFGDFDKRVHCGTVHGFKGLDADVVIILGVNERNFPKIHPDNELYSIFGVTPADVLAEEERLFYVAITRAKEKLYLLTETGRESEYFERLGLAKGTDGRKHKLSSSVLDVPF